MKKKWLIIMSLLFLVVAGFIVFKLLNNKTYNVTFNSDNNKTNQVVAVEGGHLVEEITEPTKEGYKFLGWYIGEEKFDFNSKIEEDITLVAKWEVIVLDDEIKVTFDSDGGSSINQIAIKKGNVVIKPTDPTKTGFIFVEWQLNETTYDFNTIVNEDISLKAIWKIDETVNVNKYTVKFDSNGGSSVSSKTVVENENVSKPSNPTKANYTFVEWQLDGKAYSFSSKVTKNITLKAVWKENVKVSVSFDSNGGTPVSSRQVYSGNILGTLPTAPSKTGFTFDGWYYGNTKYDANSVITNTMVLTAKWVDNNEIALNNAKNAINNSYNITKGGQVINPTYTGCTINLSNANEIAKITRNTSNSNVDLNFNITCGNKTGSKTSTGVILASPYTYTAVDSGNHINFNLTIKESGSAISGSGGVYSLSEEWLSDFTNGIAVINNSDITGMPNYKILFSNDSNTIYIIRNAG